MKDACIYAKHIGPTYEPSLYVIKTPEHLENNEIGDEGCLHLSKAHWLNL